MSFKQEQAFIQWLENFNFDSQDLTKQQQLLASRLVELKTFLQSTDFDTTGLQPQHPLFRHLQQYLSQSKQYIPAWEQAKQKLRPALMDKHLSEEKTTRNQQFFTKLNSVVQDSLGLETTKALSHYKLEIEQLLDNIDLNSNISLNVENYETFYLAIEKNLETLLHRTTEDLIELANNPLKRIREQINVLIEDLAQRKAQLLTLSS